MRNLLYLAVTFGLSIFSPLLLALAVPKLPIITPASEPNIHTIINLAAKKYAISPLLIESVIKIESNFNPQAERFEPNKHASSIGLMQVMSFNATKPPCHLKHYSELFIASLNVDCGTAILRQALNSTSSLKDALVAYNGGLGCLTSKKCLPQGTLHANKVMVSFSEAIIKNSQ